MYEIHDTHSILRVHQYFHEGSKASNENFDVNSLRARGDLHLKLKTDVNDFDNLCFADFRMKHKGFTVQLHKT